MGDMDFSRRLLSIGDRRGAKRELSRLLRSDPKNIEAWLLLAQAVDDQEQKADCYRRVIQLDPHNLAAREELHKIVQATQQKPAQRSSLVENISMNSDTPIEKEKRPLRPEPKPAKSSIQATFIARKLGVSPNEWKILVGAFIVCIILIATLSGLSIYKTIGYNIQATKTAAAVTATASAHLSCRLQFEDEMTEIFSRFFRQQSIAEVTARINLPEQISRLEEIRNEAWSMKSKSCDLELHARFMDYLDKSIFFHVAFSADDSEWVDTYIESLKALIFLDDTVISRGHPGGLVELFRERGYFYWEKLDDPNWKKGISG